MQAFGIFEGGGAKGLAHVAALAATQHYGIEFRGVAGSSAGAMVAALIAVGHRARSIYDPESDQGLLSRDITRLLGREAWGSWSRLLDDARRTFNRSGVMAGWRRLPCFYRRWRTELRSASRQRGFLSTATFEEEFEKWLQQARKPPTGESRLLFKHLRGLMPLKIIASDLEEEKAIVFSSDTTPDVPVARAVAASIAIPFLFQPVRMEINGKQRTLVDGGLVSNFPAWVFDVERRRSKEFAPLLGFRFVERVSGSPGRESLGRYLRKLMQTSLSGGNEIQIHGIDDLHVFSTEMSVSALDFDLQEDRKRQEYRSAYLQSVNFLLTEVGPKRPVALAATLDKAAAIFRSKCGFSPQHLRTNYFVSTTRETLRIVGSHNMAGDADDRLELDLQCGGTGKCWQTHRPVAVNVGQLRQQPADETGLSKYQWALVRPTLNAILSVPVFDSRKYDEMKDYPDEHKPLLGVLNFDSDDACILHFESSQAVTAAQEAAAMVALALAQKIGD
jgi:NTE family protein